jgi:hypothetical protein
MDSDSPHVLPLDSPRWADFEVYFGQPRHVPERLGLWRESIGGPAEQRRWAELSEQILHQFTITDAAYVVVPHVVRELHHVPARAQFNYLVDVALVESARQREGAPPLSDEIAASYVAAIHSAKRLAVGLLGLDWPRAEFRHVLSVVASLHGHGAMGDLLFSLDCLCGTCERCGEVVYPEDVRQSGYA